MSKLSVPISLSTVDESTLPVYLDYIKKIKAERIFFCGVYGIFCEDSLLYTNPQKISRIIDFFKSQGYEVGIWISTFGHGMRLSHESGDSLTGRFVQMQGVNGDSVSQAVCPLDKDFEAEFAEAVKNIARLNPDIIMLDDDYRLNARPYYMGCFCPLHLKEYYKRIGEEIPRDKLESLIFTGGKNKYRSAYMSLAADTLIDFAKMLRNAVDSINPSIRLGACTCFDNWDYSGTDAVEIARAFAGELKPFVRTIGAPYWSNNIIDVAENTRLQLNWCKNEDIEVFTEGDTYPRPRYNVSSAVLELFDLILLADGTADGILKYMFDYTHKPDYETGYADRHIKNEPLRKAVKKIFHGKKPVGIYSFNVMHKIENWVLPDECKSGIAEELIASYKSVSRNVLSKNTIPTSYENTGYPVFVCGENARYVSTEELKSGAILDAPGAMILKERGIDTGIVSCTDGIFEKEYFPSFDDSIANITEAGLKQIVCADSAEVLSCFLPSDSPASYYYENASGQRFFVLACDMYSGCREVENTNTDYTNNYYRQAQIIEAAQRVGGSPLPAVCLKNPDLYMLTSKGDGAMSVALANVFPDEVISPEIVLDGTYSRINFVNCTGRLDGNTVYLSDISPYGFAAFEVDNIEL